MASSLFLDLNTMFSPSLVDIYSMYSSFAVCLLRLMNCGFMIKFIYEQHLNLLNSFMYDWLSLQVSSNYQFGLAY